MINIMIFKEDNDALVLRDSDLIRLLKEPKLILWIRNGIYGVIPIETVRANVAYIKEKSPSILREKIRLYAAERGDYQPNKEYRVTDRSLTYDWAEVVEIPVTEK